jgi:hypothetical protein
MIKDLTTGAGYHSSLDGLSKLNPHDGDIGNPAMCHSLSPDFGPKTFEMGNDEWVRLEQLQDRLVLTGQQMGELLSKFSRNNGLVVSSGASKILEPAEAKSCFTSLNNSIRLAEDRSEVLSYIERLIPLVVNGKDKPWIENLSEKLQFVPPPELQVRMLARAAFSILTAHPALTNKLLGAISRVDAGEEFPPGISTAEMMVEGFLSTQFPVRHFRHVLDACDTARIRFPDASEQKGLQRLRDIFMAGSFPGEDTQLFVAAVESAVAQTPHIDTRLVKTTIPGQIETMLKNAWMQVMAPDLDAKNITKLTAYDPMPDNSSRRAGPDSLLSNTVRVLSQPSLAANSQLSLGEQYAYSCLVEFRGCDTRSQQPVTELNALIEELAGKKQLLAILFGPEFQEGAKVLKEQCPGLVVAFKGHSDRSRYSRLVMEEVFINKSFERSFKEPEAQKIIR